ncbi:DUF7373 family lipoprotein [Nocardia sp. CDC160]|uniref:DUF7373 family lipoprotein n=1 Tax=Nocardia sp. CDC160 TaxID=3112166 RepID=UPI002DB8CB93|nr:hypothetical protein [Nocardia sp. CDC160]MEC3913283.1 hypothetical protein [Nocardia sp. CDC160]
MNILEARRRGGRTALGAVVLITTTAVLAGCGTTAGKPVAGEFDIRKLSVGQYPTEPADIRASYSHSPANGKELAIGRLANAVVIGPDVDPIFNHAVSSVSLSGPTALALVLSTVAEPVAERNDMQFGYAASVSTKPLSGARDSGAILTFSPFGGMQPDPDATSFNVTVLQFPDQQRASTAAQQMEEADFAVAADQNQRVALDKQPDAKAHWRPGIPSMGTTLAHGQYAISVFVQQPKPELAGLKSLTEQILAAQLPLLDALPPLSPREVLRLDYDPQGLLRRTLHPGKALYPHAETEITSTPRGLIHTIDNQPSWKTLLDNNGVDYTATTRNGALLLRAKDPKAATAVWSTITGGGPTPIDKATDVPDTSCVESTKGNKPQRFDDEDAWDKSDRFVCLLHYDRYVAVVAGAQLADVTQRAAAQYALLVNSQYM